MQILRKEEPFQGPRCAKTKTKHTHQQQKQPSKTRVAAINAYRLPDAHGAPVAAQEHNHVGDLPRLDEATDRGLVQHGLGLRRVSPRFPPHVGPGYGGSYVVHLEEGTTGRLWGKCQTLLHLSLIHI